MSGSGDTSLRDRGDELLARYGDELKHEDMSEQQKREFLLALARIMQAFVDLGFSIKPGDNFTGDTDLGMDNVLEYLVFDDNLAPIPELEDTTGRNKNDKSEE